MKDPLYSVRRLHGRLHEWRVNMLPLYMERWRHPRAVYLVLTPEHGNLGDHAIAQSEIEILQSLKTPYIEVSGKTLLDWGKKQFLHVMNGRPVLINGGGNLGTLWFHNELILRQIMTDCPDSSLVIFPSTIYYSEDEKGKEELENSVRIYNSKKDLSLFAREKTSYTLMASKYKKVFLVPDMVFRMNKSIPGMERKGCILSLRSDREKTRTDEAENMIRGQVEAVFGSSVRELDMVLPYSVPVENRDEELEKQYDAFRHAELVITDRLHGMIFCAITGTPCIVINSKSPKVRGCYEWIKDLPYIQFCDDVSQIAEIYKAIPKQDWQYDNTKLLPLYEPLIAEIKAASRGR